MKIRIESNNTYEVEVTINDGTVDHVETIPPDGAREFLVTELGPTITFRNVEAE